MARKSGKNIKLTFLVRQKFKQTSQQEEVEQNLLIE